ncbi:MAG: CotH kinase family protein [Magnetococcales bacterium]|nr:CotH kinase family protein [Magnetococcales bacterium]
MKTIIKLPLSPAAHRRLTWFNTAIIVCIFFAVSVDLFLNRVYISEKIQQIFERHVTSSVAVEWFESDPKHASDLSIPKYQIGINPKLLRKIEELSKKASQKGVLTKEDKEWFPIMFSFEDGKPLKAEMRLRGDLSLHWAKPKKSWRIKIKRNEYKNGYREINLVIPQERTYEVEQVVYELGRRMGLVVPDSGFARVSLNQVDLGLYFWYEQRSKEMLERQRLPEGQIFVEDNAWLESRYSTLKQTIFNKNSLLADYQPAIRKDPSTASLIQKRWQEFCELMLIEDDQTVLNRLPHILDVDGFVKWNALLLIFGSHHAQYPSNLTWYYNTSNGLFSPILNDVHVFPLGKRDRNILIPVDRTTGSLDSLSKDSKMLVQRILAIPDIAFQRNRTLYQMIHDQGEEIIDLLKQRFGEIRASVVSLGITPQDPDALDKNHKKRIQDLQDNMTLLDTWVTLGRVFITGEQQQKGERVTLQLTITPEGIHRLAFEQLSIKFPSGHALGNLDLDLHVSGPDNRSLTVKPIKTALENGWLKLSFDQLFFWEKRTEYLQSEWTDWRLTLSFNNPEQEKRFMPVEAEYRFRHGLTGEPIPPHMTRHSPFTQPLEGGDPAIGIVDFLAGSSLPFQDDGINLTLPAGEYSVTGSIVIPGSRGLVLEAGAHLKMGPGASILAYRALQSLGTAKQPVVIEPLSDGMPWGVVAIVNAQERSTLLHTVIRGGNQEWLNGIFFSGQINFYYSPVTVQYSRIEQGQADDGLNIKHASILIENSEISDNSSDGFDGDWVTGIIRHCVIKNNGGDGLDFSGSELLITDTLFDAMGDKAISAGEKSTIHLFNSRMENSKIGLAAKDLSTVFGYASHFQNNETAVALYQKKPIFGGSRVQIFGSLFWKNQKSFFLDESSRLSLVGVGLDKAEEWGDSIEMQDLRLGDPGLFYQYDSFGNPVYKPTGDSASSPFATGPITTPTTIQGVTIPDLSSSPVGLRAALLP